MQNNYQRTFSTQSGQVPYVTQQSHPVYQPSMSQISSAPIYTQQQSVFQPGAPVPQQPPPPPYPSSAVQFPSPQTYPPQQQTFNNPRTGKVPFTPGYKWPHKSIHLICPQCGASVTTRVDRKITIVTIIAAAILFFFTCILVCLPFFIPSCKKTLHSCPYCKSRLGVRSEIL